VPDADPTPTCEARDLQLTYRGGGWGGGSDFGVIAITNRGARTCQLARGRLQVLPLDRAGRVIPTAEHWRNTVPVAALILGADGKPPTGGSTPPAEDRWLDVLIGGDERDGAAPDGLCPAREEATPASWLVLGRINARVANTDEIRLANHSPSLPAHLYACGVPTLALLNLTIAAAP
jgi:hypothetical protein